MPPRRKTGTAAGASGASVLPVIGAGTLLEDESRRLFEQVTAPWECQRRERDHGIDLDVDILAPVAGGKATATGKRFSVQLKATRSAEGSDRRSLKTSSIRYWYDNTSPVLLVYSLIPEPPPAGAAPVGEMFYRWVDDEFLAELTERNPAWQLQDEVTVSLPRQQRLDANALAALESYVRAGGRRRRFLPSGTYNVLRDEALACAGRLRQHAASCEIASVPQEMDDLILTLHSSLYTVALTGPARVGKSTLLNALVGIEISPVGDFPTTAVPLILKAGRTPTAVVHFLDGAKQVCAATVDAIRPFAEQDLNEDNRRRVQAIEISLPNALLEQGVVLLDLPGLHDASEQVRSATLAALDRANAVVYVLSAARMKDGEFNLDQTLISDLLNLQRNKDRVIVALNKSAELTPNDRERLSQYIERQLRKKSLWQHLPHAPFFLDGKSAHLARSRGTPAPNEQLEFERWLWEFLHATNSTGVQRLIAASKALHTAAERFASLLALRVVDGAKAAAVQQSLESCRLLRKELQTASTNRLRDERRRVTETLVEMCVAEATRFKARLVSVSLDDDLPSIGEVRKLLDTSWQTAAGAVWQEFIARHSRWAAQIEAQVNKAIDKAAEAAGLPHGLEFVLPEPAEFAFAEVSFEEAWGLAAAAAILTVLFSPPAALFSAAAGWIAGFFAGRRRRRQQQIEAAEKRFTAGLERAISSLRPQFYEKIALSMEHVSTRARARLELFVQDAEQQLKLLGTPVAEAERTQLLERERGVRDEAQAIATLQERLWSALGGSQAQRPLG